MHSAATVHYAEVQDFRVYPIVQQHGRCTAIVLKDLQCSAGFSYTSHCATWSLYGARISKCLQCRARSSNTFQSCNIVAVRCSCHKIFNVVQDSRIRVIMQQRGCHTVLLSQQQYIQHRARFSYTVHSCNRVAGRTAISVFCKYICSDTNTVFYKYARSEMVT